MTHRPLRSLAALAALALLAVACSAPAGVASGDAGDGCPTSQPAALPTGETRTVTIATDLGNIVIAVKADLAPIATGNFVALAECGYYDGVVFQRVVPGFVIQGGDGEFGRTPDIDRGRVGSGGPGYEIKDDPVTAIYARGVAAMARSQRPDSQGSQFFIILDDEAAFSLTQANNYAILGAVTSGMDVVDAIAAAADAEIPSKPVVMTDVSVAAP